MEEVEGAYVVEVEGGGGDVNEEEGGDVMDAKSDELKLDELPRHFIDLEILPEILRAEFGDGTTVKNYNFVCCGGTTSCGPPSYAPYACP